MIVAPTEPEMLRRMATTVGTWGETRFGADVVWRVHGRWIGVQRKEVADLIASVQDGRLGQNLSMMRGLDIGVLLVEGAPKFTVEGEMLAGGYGRGLTKAQWRGVLWSAAHEGLWVDHTASVRDTCEWVGQFHAWTAKDKHGGLLKRNGPIVAWGKPGNDDFAKHLLMGLPGVGPEMAGRIVERFGGVPWKWTVSREELLTVEGIGPKTADRIMGVFG